MKKQLLLPFLALLFLLPACNTANPNTENKEEEQEKSVPEEKENTDTHKTDTHETESAKISVQDAKKIMEDYSNALTSKDFEKFEALFAPTVVQWITLKNTNPKAITKATIQFLTKKPEAAYKANLDKVSISGDRIITEMLVTWNNYEAEVLVEIELDDQQKISYYKEKEILSQTRSSGGSSTRKDAFAKLLSLKAPYDMQTGEKDKRFYLGSMSGSEEMKPFYEDVNELPSQLYGKLKIHDNVWLVFVDLTYRFSIDYSLFTYDNNGNKLEEGPGGSDVKLPTVDKDFVITTHDGKWKVNKKGAFEKQ
jgi:hypothetical protein